MDGCKQRQGSEDRQAGERGDIDVGGLRDPRKHTRLHQARLRSCKLENFVWSVRILPPKWTVTMIFDRNSSKFTYQWIYTNWHAQKSSLSECIAYYFLTTPSLIRSSGESLIETKWIGSDGEPDQEEKTNKKSKEGKKKIREAVHFSVISGTRTI